jgi:ketosteroid isomerase-like protein
MTSISLRSATLTRVCSCCATAKQALPYCAAVASNAEIARQLFMLVGAVDEARILDLVTEDVVVDVSRRVVDPGVYRGREGVRAFVGQLAMAWGHRRVEPDEFIEHGEQVIVPVKIVNVGRASGIEVTAQAAWVVAFRDDQVCALTAHQSREEALAAVGLR